MHNRGLAGIGPSAVFKAAAGGNRAYNVLTIQLKIELINAGNPHHQETTPSSSIQFSP